MHINNKRFKRLVDRLTGESLMEKKELAADLIGWENYLTCDHYYYGYRKMGKRTFDWAKYCLEAEVE